MIEERDDTPMGLSLDAMSAAEFMRHLSDTCDGDPLTAFIVLARVHGMSYEQIAKAVRRIGRAKLSKQMVHHRICAIDNQQLSTLLKEIRTSKHSTNYFKDSIIGQDAEQMTFKF